MIKRVCFSLEVGTTIMKHGTTQILLLEEAIAILMSWLRHTKTSEIKYIKCYDVSYRTDEIFQSLCILGIQKNGVLLLDNLNLFFLTKGLLYMQQ
jgi:hypothetical protein